ncbi:hypothetical protein SAMN05443667_1221 [Flavobacterium gillisiae]|uniref:Uncharacterized protein n=1 Tax=Flavobacterium gillisiae TaxID=150146 RepID=A0A1H4GCH7_9FLAO|nr:hypothetical protein SAMN05443667_1221 [Flavobacterium gillisiae]
MKNLKMLLMLFIVFTVTFCSKEGLSPNSPDNTGYFGRTVPPISVEMVPL